MLTTVFLHVGLHKTGTTYLQNVWLANEQTLRDLGIAYPGRPAEAQGLAVGDLQGRRRARGFHDKRVSGAWDRVVETLVTGDCHTAVFSHETLSLSSPRQVARAAGSFGAAEVHVVLTVRDLGRVLVSSWQETVKSNKTWTFREYADAVKDPERIGRDPARGFWLHHDAVRVSDTWAAAVGRDRVHIVTVPPAGAEPIELLRRLSAVIGYDVDRLANPPVWSNEALGNADVEVLRRLNERLAGRLNDRQYRMLVKRTLTHRLAQRPGLVRFGLPIEERGWVSERAEHMIEQLAGRGYPVTGSLEDLRPRYGDDPRNPDDATGDELLDAALDSLALLAEDYSKAWWAQHRKRFEDVNEQGGWAFRTRSTVYDVKVRLGGLANRSAWGGRAAGVAVRQQNKSRSRRAGKPRSMDD